MSLRKTIFVEEIRVSNPLIELHGESIATGGADDNYDIGLFGQYWDGNNLVYTGLFRDATDGKFKLFDSLQVLPIVDTGVVDTAGAGFTLADLSVNDLEVTGDAVVTGNTTINGDLIIAGSTTTVNTVTLLVQDNIIVANAGPTAQKEDSGFAILRTTANVVAGDTAKESGTIGTNGTSNTAFTLDALLAGQGNANYYNGWIIEFTGGSASGSAQILTTGTSGEVDVTVGAGITGTPQAGDTFNLYNKRYTGLIYDESTDKLSAFGFPVEDQQNVFDPLAVDGKASEYVDFIARDVDATNDLNVAGNANVTGTLTVDSITVTNPITVTGGDILKSVVVSGTTNVTATQVNENDIIYVDTSGGNATVNLPTISSLGLSAGEAQTITIVNTSTNNASVEVSGGDEVEGSTDPCVLARQYMKFTLIASADLANQWIIQ
jgi:hypothetical protein